VLHYWFPVYDREFRACSPGTELYLQVVRAAAASGIQRIDFGYGEEPYKLRIANRTSQLACGQVGGSAWQWQLGRMMDAAHRHVRKSRYRNLIRDAVRLVAPTAGKAVVR
jgi:hypothetical protein